MRTITGSGGAPLQACDDISNPSDFEREHSPRPTIRDAPFLCANVADGHVPSVAMW